MTLKEKFENVLHDWIDKDYNKKHVANELEIDADKFAIEFAEWILDWPEDWHRIGELLEIYKKEKGL